MSNLVFSRSPYYFSTFKTYLGMTIALRSIRNLDFLDEPMISLIMSKETWRYKVTQKLHRQNKLLFTSLLNLVPQKGHRFRKNKYTYIILINWYQITDIKTFPYELLYLI